MKLMADGHSLNIGASPLPPGRGIVEAIIETAKAIREIFMAGPQSQQTARENLRRAFEHSETRRAVRQAFTGTGGQTFNAKVSRIVIVEAVKASFSPESLDTVKDSLLGIYVDGDAKRIIKEREGNRPKLGAHGRGTFNQARGDFNFKRASTGDFIEDIFLEIQLHIFSAYSQHAELPKDNRRLQEISLPSDSDFICPGVTGCFLPQNFVNDRKCDCPETCADEDVFTCDSCVPEVPFGASPETQSTATALGVSLGVSLGVALGVGLGVGLGLSAGIGAYLAEGEIQMAVESAQQFSSSPQVQQAIKSSLVRLASLQIPLTAVSLIWGCAIDAVSSRKLRRLGEIVDLCFEIQLEGEEEGLHVCSKLDSTPLGTAEHVINEELVETGAGSGIEVVHWNPNPNPRAKNPGARPLDSLDPLPSINTGVNLG